MTNAAPSTNPHEHAARAEKVSRVLETLGPNVAGDLVAYLLKSASDETWAFIEERAGVRRLSAYSRSLVVEAVRARGGGFVPASTSIAQSIALAKSTGNPARTRRALAAEVLRAHEQFVIAEENDLSRGYSFEDGFRGEYIDPLRRAEVAFLEVCDPDGTIEDDEDHEAIVALARTVLR